MSSQAFGDIAAAVLTVGTVIGTGVVSVIVSRRVRAEDESTPQPEASKLRALAVSQFAPLPRSTRQRRSGRSEQSGPSGRTVWPQQPGSSPQSGSSWRPAGRRQFSPGQSAGWQQFAPGQATRSPQPLYRQPASSRWGKRRDADLLPAGASVTFGEEREAANIDEILADLDRDLIGLVPIKRKVEEIAALLLVDGARRKFGMSSPRPNMHMCFTGPPGTGKTTMALRMAQLLHRLGYLEQGKLVHAMRDDLVGEFVGQTAPRTRRVLERAMGGVLFIDEAYYLYRASDSKDYGQEAIEILLQVMENERENLVVILAGYKDRMDEFFQSNPGMSSRITHHLDFAPYDAGELVSIGQLMLEQSSYYLSAEAEVALRESLARELNAPGFANARSVRNQLDRARLRHAYRLAAEPGRNWSRDDLMRLEASDILDGNDDLRPPDPAR